MPTIEVGVPTFPDALLQEPASAGQGVGGQSGTEILDIDCHPGAG
jgi:hypothetical protein